MTTNTNTSNNKKIGQIPGSIVYTGKKTKNTLDIELLDYTSDNVTENKFNKIEEVFDYYTSDSVSWININGLNHVDAIEKIGQHYELHPLVQEDIVYTAQRPKTDDYEDYLFVVVKMLYYNKRKTLVVEQVSFVLGKNYVLSFQESEGDVFDEVRERIRQKKGRIRTFGADYLLFSLLDAIIDYYYEILEVLDDKIEQLETQLFLGKADDATSKKIQDLKREILRVRRAIFPFREVINKIEKHEGTLVTKRTKAFYRDLYDQLVQVSENIEINREMIWSLMDMHMTTISNKMNEVMKVLTIMASIFIPLTFIAGIYGMNFENIPELKYQNAYFVLWGIFIVLVLLMVLYFKRKKWL